MENGLGGRLFQSFLLLVSNFLLVTVPPDVSRKHPDYGLNTLEISRRYGYQSEEHNVVTEDGYILTLHRIAPRGLGLSDRRSGAGAVLMFHGLLLSSVDWVNAGPGRALGLLLSDSGYDVWLANARGTTWSRNHTTLSPDDPLFWDFSLHEMAKYDVPAMIDYVSEVTNERSIFYVGHSQGNMIMYATVALRPEYNKRIRLGINLAPVIYGIRQKNLLFGMIRNYNRQIVTMANRLGINQIGRHSDLIANITYMGCRPGSPFQSICHAMVQSMVGFNSEQLDADLLPMFLSNMPAGGSLKQLLHITQNFNTGIFQSYDLGPKENERRYGQREPLKYNLDLVTLPMAFFYSGNDWLSTEADVERISRELPNIVIKHRLSRFTHLDYLWAKDAAESLHSHILAAMRHY